MDPRTASAETAQAADIEAIDNILTDLDLGDEALSDSDASVVEVMETIDDAHADAEVSASDVPASVEEVAAKPEKTEKKERKARAPRDLTDLDPSVFTMFDGDVADDAYKADVIAKRPTQKKIGEKFDNLFQSLAAGRKPSVYVMACFAVLDEKRQVTQTDLVAALKATNSKKGTGYNDGTARSQAGQIMTLFSTVGIAKREKQTLTINDNSAIAAKLRALA